MCLLRRDCGFLLWRLIKVDQIINNQEEEETRHSLVPVLVAIIRTDAKKLKRLLLPFFLCFGDR